MVPVDRGRPAWSVVLGLLLPDGKRKLLPSTQRLRRRNFISSSVVNEQIQSVYEVFQMAWEKWQPDHFGLSKMRTLSCGSLDLKTV